MSQADTAITSKNVDLTNCDREQIQYAGAIQPHGALLVLKEPELRIIQASCNTGELLGVAAEELINQDLTSLFTDTQIASMRDLFHQETLAGAPTLVGRAKFFGREFDLLAHRYDQVLIFELERRPETAAGSVDPYSELRSAIYKLEATHSLQQFLDLAVQQIRAFTGFDRVMIYQFLETGSGWVRAEAIAQGEQPYLGLHYPPSDIPAPARRLFSLTWVRHQPDIAYTPVPLLPQHNPVTGGPLDMSYSLLRSVSIMYIDYLKNMGTQSSMVMTLLKEGKLWGLIACHHHSSPKHVPYETRAACEFLTHMVSLLVSAKDDTESNDYRLKLKFTHASIVENNARSADFVSGFTEDTPNLLHFVKAPGAAIIGNGHITPIGVTPAASEIEQIVKWLPSALQQDIFTTDCLSAHFAPAIEFKERCAGLVALRFPNANNDFVLWFRPEVLQTVNWAGDPNKPVDISDDGQRLFPRTSFALWKETVRLKSTPWTNMEMEAVRDLRAALLELAFRRTEEGTRRMYADLQRSHSELDSFVYVASHDLKEPIRGIHNYAEMLTEDYSDNLDDEGKAKLATIGRLSLRMEHLLDSLLEYSRAGAAALATTDVDLNRTVEVALDLLRARIERDAVVISMPRPLPVVQGDRTRLIEVFTNVISNAIKYNDKAVKEIEIGYQESAPAGRPVIYVQDNGIGIEKKHDEHVFQIFRRLHARSEYGGGSGAGLTIVKKIISRHGGRIWLESTPGQGTTFYFTLAESASGETA